MNSLIVGQFKKAFQTIENFRVNRKSESEIDYDNRHSTVLRDVEMYCEYVQRYNGQHILDAKENKLILNPRIWLGKDFVKKHNAEEEVMKPT